MEIKTCTKCGIKFPKSEEFFYRRSTGIWFSNCKDCNKKRVSEYKKRTNWKSNRKWQKNNKEYFRIYMNNLNNKIRQKLGIGYVGLHKWVNHNKPKPQYCTICNEEKRLELHCFDHNYTRDLTKWIYVCKSCHYKLNTLIRKYGKV